MDRQVARKLLEATALATGARAPMKRKGTTDLNEGDDAASVATTKSKRKTNHEIPTRKFKVANGILPRIHTQWSQLGDDLYFEVLHDVHPTTFH